MKEHGRTSITAEELRVWRGYIETAEALRSRLESRFQSDSALSSGDYAVLLALSEAEGQSLRSSDLAGAIGWERSRLSHHLGRMEKRALIRRSQRRRHAWLAGRAHRRGGSGVPTRFGAAPACRP